MEIVTGEQMRRIDRHTIEKRGIPGLALMESAGRGVADALLRDHARIAGRGIVVLCGKGNNGGDGLVAARRLAERGAAPSVWLLAEGSALRGDAALSLSAARAAGVEIEEVPTEAEWSVKAGALERAGLVLDAILGTGIHGGARGLAASVIERLASLRVPLLALDVPSGLDADSGEVAGPAVRALHTFTLCRPKLCLVLEPAASHTGTWSVVDIGIPDDVVAEERSPYAWIDGTAAGSLLPRRRSGDHKGSFGHLLAVAGSRDKSGAAVLLGRAALRAGAGLVTVATARTAQTLVAVQQPELMTEPLDEDAAGTLTEAAAPRVLALLAERDALAIGPGLGGGAGTAGAIRAMLDGRKAAAVLDADGLNAFAPNDEHGPAPLRAGKFPLVLTPHPGEAARLLDRDARAVQSDRLAAARRLAHDTGAVVVLKGHRTITADPEGRASFNASGNPGMATAGTGDALTGIVGALLARGVGAGDAARLAVFVHGDAGDRAAAEMGQDGMVAGDLVARIPAALAGLAALALRRGSA